MFDRCAVCLFLPLFLLLSLGSVGCGQDSSERSAADAADTGETSGSSETPSADAPAVEPLPEGLAPGPKTAGADEVSLGEPIQGPGIAFQLPTSWQSVEPTSSMRMGEAVIPGEAGDGELTIFYFGAGGGGGVEANLQRWAGQMDLAQQPERQTFSPHEALTVTWIDCIGTLKASTMGTGPTTDQAGYRLFGAVVEGPGGPWFFKATGPETTLAAARDGFVALLESLRPASATA